MTASAWIPKGKLGAKLGVTRRTIDRWLQPKNAHINFPRPRVVNDRAEIEAWKLATAIKKAREV